MRLAYVKEIKNTHLLTLGIDGDGESVRFTVSASVYASLGRPAVGEELSEHVYAELSYADELYRAEKKALSLLSFADNNERTLLQKLLRAGFCRDVARSVCERMVMLGYVDEERQLERLILKAANEALLAERRICEKLRAKGYASSLVDRVMSRLVCSGEIDFSENKERLLSRLPDDATDEERIKLLYKHGYRYD